jgi:hypothetical protein
LFSRGSLSLKLKKITKTNDKENRFFFLPLICRGIYKRCDFNNSLEKKKFGSVSPVDRINLLRKGGTKKQTNQNKEKL